MANSEGQNAQNKGSLGGMMNELYTKEEINVFRECKRESLYYRCLPLSTVFRQHLVNFLFPVSY